MVTVLRNYYNYDVVQNTADVQESPNFPDVTVCNLFPISDRKNFDVRYKGYLKKLDLLRSHRRSPKKFRCDSNFWSFLRSLIAYNVNTLDRHIGEGDDCNEDGFVVESSQYQWDLYKGSDCPFVMEFNRPLQKCVRFQASRNDTALIKMIFFVDDFWSDVVDSFYSWTRMPMSTGVRVMVHARGTKPDPKTSVFVAPGSDLTITVKQTNITRLSYPRGNCSNRRLMRSDPARSIPYNQAACLSLCRQRQVIQMCHCIDTFEFFSEAQLQSVNGTFCLNISHFLSDAPPPSDSVIDELWKVVKCVWYFDPVDDICDCPVECSNINYEFSLSESRWPSPVYQLAFYDRYLRRDNRYSSKFSAYETIRKDRRSLNCNDTLRRVRDLKLIEENFLQVTVKMNDKKVTAVADILVMSWDTMASNLGGSLNLWLGISVLTAAEIIELFYSLMQILLNRKRTDVQVPEKAETVVIRPEISQYHNTGNE